MELLASVLAVLGILVLILDRIYAILLRLRKIGTVFKKESKKRKKDRPTRKGK